MLNKPTKLCRACNKNESLSWRKNCLACINKLAKEKQREQRKAKEEKVKVKKQLAKTKKSFSIPVLKKKLWVLVSEYTRRKYADEFWMVSCVSCGSIKHWKEMQAWHYIPAGSSNYLRYNENNIHPQDYACNVWRHWNLIEYRIFMVNKYGENFVEMMTGLRNKYIKHTTEYILWKIEEYEAKLDILNK